MTPLDPADYVVVPHVAALDVFEMRNPDGSFAANITDAFLDRLIDHMNEREKLTGDLSPLVIGHTKDGEREIDSPPVVGFARNWHKGVLGETDRSAAFFDAWIKKDCVDLARQYPRRSCEVWVDRFEVDPISLLGATTPARDLGLMKLSREGSLVVESPGALTMPEKEDKKPEPDKKESGQEKGEAGKLDQIMSMLTELLSKIGGPPAPEAPKDEPAPEGGDELSDEEFEKLLGGMGGKEDESRAGEKPVPNEGGYGGGSASVPMLDQVKKLERQVEEQRVQLARRDVRDALKAIADKGKDVNADDEGLVADLVALPPDMRARQLSRIESMAKGKPGVTSSGFEMALANATEGGAKRITADDKSRIIKLARERGHSFERVARDEGYTL